MNRQNLSRAALAMAVAASLTPHINYFSAEQFEWARRMGEYKNRDGNPVYMPRRKKLKGWQRNHKTGRKA